MVPSIRTVLAATIVAAAMGSALRRQVPRTRPRSRRRRLRKLTIACDVEIFTRRGTTRLGGPLRRSLAFSARQLAASGGTEGRAKCRESSLLRRPPGSGEVVDARSALRPTVGSRRCRLCDTTRSGLTRNRWFPGSTRWRRTWSSGPRVGRRSPPPRWRPRLRPAAPDARSLPH